MSETAELIAAIQAERELLASGAEIDTYRIDVMFAEAVSRLSALQGENDRLKVLLRSIDVHATASARSCGDIAENEFLTKFSQEKGNE